MSANREKPEVSVLFRMDRWLIIGPLVRQDIKSFLADQKDTSKLPEVPPTPHKKPTPQ